MERAAEEDDGEPEAHHYCSENCIGVGPTSERYRIEQRRQREDERRRADERHHRAERLQEHGDDDASSQIPSRSPTTEPALASFGFRPLITMVIAGLSTPYVDFLRGLRAQERITTEDVEQLNRSVDAAAQALDGATRDEVRRLLRSAGFNVT